MTFVNPLFYHYSHKIILWHTFTKPKRVGILNGLLFIKWTRTIEIDRIFGDPICDNRACPFDCGGIVVPIPVYKCTPWVPDPIDVRSAPSLSILCLRVYWWLMYCVDSVIGSLYFLCLRVYWWFVCCVDSVINSLIFPIKFVFYTWHIDLYFKIKIYVWNKTQNNFFYFFQSRKYWNVHVY